MHLGLCTISNGDWPVDDVIELAADVGCDAVEIWGRGHVGDRTPSTIDRIRERAADHGVDIAVYGSYIRPGSEEYDELVEAELEIADRLGASAIRAWAGTQEYQERTSEHWDHVVTEMVDLADRAGDHGLEVTVEKHEGTLTNTGEGARRLIEAVDRKHCRLNWQPLFGLPADGLVEEAKALAPISNNIHVQAVPEVGGTWEDRCLLESAHFDLPAALRAFDDAGFDGCVEIEFVTDDLPFETAVRRDVAYLESIVG